MEPFPIVCTSFYKFAELQILVSTNRQILNKSWKLQHTASGEMLKYFLG